MLELMVVIVLHEGDTNKKGRKYMNKNIGRNILVVG
jgi:hypothetical protein